MNWKAIIVCFLVVIIMAPTIILAIMESPWFLLILFALLLIFPFVLAPSTDEAGQHRDAGPLATIALVVSLVFGGFVLAVGLLVAPEFFLLMIIVCAPILWLAFRPEA